MTECRQEDRTGQEDIFHPLAGPAALLRDRKEFVVRMCEGRSVLHIGCVGSGSVRERLRDGSHLHSRLARSARSLAGIDLNEEGLSHLREAGFERCYPLDIERERISDSILLDTDIIVVPEVLEHLSNPGRFLDHLKDLDFPGDILISVPNAFSYRVYELVKNNRLELVHPDHKYYFSQTTLKTLLSSHGFRVLNHWLYYWPSEDPFGKGFEKSLQVSPDLAEGIIVLARDARHVPEQDRGGVPDGEAQFRAGDLASAEKSFLETLRCDPGNVEVYNNLGVLEFSRNEPEAALRYFNSALQIDPFHKDAVINLAEILKVMGRLPDALPYLKKVQERHPGDRELENLIQEAGTVSGPVVNRTLDKTYPWKLCYSSGIALHGENARRMLRLDHYVPSLHVNDPVWFFGVYFDSDYHQILAHQGRKIINWRGADTLRMQQKQERVTVIRETKALHVCQARHQKELLAGFGIPSIVRPMMNTPIATLRLTPFPKDRTAILVYWRRGEEDYIQAEIFFKVAARCPDVVFHIAGHADPSRFNQPGMENLQLHGFVPEEELDSLMDRCKGTIRPWIWDGNPNIQTRMLLKGRYAAHSLSFEKVSQCATTDDYVRWIQGLRNITEPNLEAREWWMKNLNRFDFLEPDFDPEAQA